MQKAGHDDSLPSKNAVDLEQSFLKKFSLKKVTVPKEKLQDVVNLTVQNESSSRKERIDTNYNTKKTSANKFERLEYRDLSKVMRANVPWWLGNRGALSNYSGERLASLVEVTCDERNCESERLKAGVEQEPDFQTIGSKCSVDIAEILSKGMEICFTDAGPKVRTVSLAAKTSEISNKSAASKYHISDNIEMCYKTKDIQHESASKIKESLESAAGHSILNGSEVNIESTKTKLESECENKLSTSRVVAAVDSQTEVLTNKVTKVEAKVESRKKVFNSAATKLEAELISESKISASNVTKAGTKVESRNKKAEIESHSKAEYDSEHKDNSAEMIWIEERLNRVQKLLASLDDLRLRSGCEKCQGKCENEEDSLQDESNSSYEGRKNHGPNIETGASFERNKLQPDASNGKPSGFNRAVKQDSRSLSSIIRPSGSIVRARICKCDLDVINNEMTSLCCYMENLAQKQCTFIEKSQFNIITNRVQQIRNCFCELTNKIMAESMKNSAAASEIFEEAHVYHQEVKNDTALETESSNEYDTTNDRPSVRGSLNPNNNHRLASRDNCACVYKKDAHRFNKTESMEDNLAEMPNSNAFLEPPAAWCEQVAENLEGGCRPEVLFVPCFYYNPATGECKFPETKTQLQKHQQRAATPNNTVENEPKSQQQCHCCSNEISKEDNVKPLRQRSFINTSDLIPPKVNLPRIDKKENTTNKVQHRPEQQKDTAKARSPVDSNFRRDMAILSKQAYSRRKPISDHQSENSYSRDRNVGEILSQDMKMSQQRLNVEYNDVEDSASTGTPSLPREKFLAAPRSRLRDSGLNLEMHDDCPNDASTERSKNLKSHDETINGKTVVRVNTVCCCIPEDVAQLPKPSLEHSRWQNQEVPGPTRKEPFKRSNPKSQVGYAEDQKRRINQEHSKKSNLENEKRLSKELNSRRSQELQSAESNTRQDFARRWNREPQDVRSRESSYRQRQPQRSSTEYGKGISIKLYGQPKQESQNRTNQGQKKRLSVESEGTAKVEQQRQNVIKPEMLAHQNLPNPQEVSTTETEENCNQNEKAGFNSIREKNFERQPRNSNNEDASKRSSRSKPKQTLSQEQNLKCLKPTVSFKQQSNPAQTSELTENPNNRMEELSKKFGDICKELCDNSFQQLSEVCKQYYENPSDPDKQMCEIPCRTLCYLCRNSCNGIVEKLISNHVVASSSNKENATLASTICAQNNPKSLQSVTAESSQKSYQACLNDSLEKHDARENEHVLEMQDHKEVECPNYTENLNQKCAEFREYLKQKNELHPVEDPTEAKQALKKPIDESFKRTCDCSQENEKRRLTEIKNKETSESVTRKSYENNCNSELLKNYEFHKDSVRPVTSIQIEETLSHKDELFNDCQNPCRTDSPIILSRDKKKLGGNLEDIRICMSRENIRDAMPSTRNTNSNQRDTISNTNEGVPSTRNLNSSTRDSSANANNTIPIRNGTNHNCRDTISNARDAMANNRDSEESVKRYSGGDAPKNPLFTCCCCEGVPPIEGGLGTIIQNRIKNRKRGTVFLKFTMCSNSLYHIQMATVDSEFLGCFYATENAVVEARKHHGFDGCITLSVMEASNSPSQVSRLVDHAFMIVQQESKSQ